MKKNSGQSLIEVLVVMVAGSIMIIAVVSLVLNSLKSSQFAQNQTQATKYAQEAIDKIKDIRVRNGVVEYSCGVGCGAAKFSELWDVLPQSCTTNDCYFTFDIDTNNFLKLVGNRPTGDHPGGDQNLTRETTLTKLGNEITVGVKVKWSDSSGDHESNLQTTLNR